MASATKLYYLVRDKQFWEIEVRDKETVIRSGKIGCPGRSFPAKKHETAAKALSFGRRQVNAKIMQGFTNRKEENGDGEEKPKSAETDERLKSPSPKHRNTPKTPVVKTLSITPKQKPRPPLKKRETIRRLVLQKSMKAQLYDKELEAKAAAAAAAAAAAVTNAAGSSAANTLENGNIPTAETTPKPPWRKPPKKQSTIRQLMRKMPSFRTGKTASIIHNVSGGGGASGSGGTLEETEPTTSGLRRTPTLSRRKRSIKVPRRYILDSEMEDIKPPASKMIKVETQQSFPKTLGTVSFVDQSSNSAANLDALKEALGRTALTKADTLDVNQLTGSKSSMLARMPSLTVGSENIYIPPKRDWPLQLTAPVIWEKSCPDENTSAYAVYVDDNHCLCGDDDGRVIELDSLGNTSRVFQLRAEVKCIITEAEFTYVGCSDGVVYEISSGVPRCLYQCPLSSFAEVQGLALCDGILVSSNVRGHLCAVNHEGRTLWQKRSPGDGGWMLCVDAQGVYHGHSRGVTKYDLLTGKKSWHKGWVCSIFAGVQGKECIFAADNSKVLQIAKSNGNTENIYSQEGSGCIMSVALGGTLLFAAGSACITCYDEKTAKPIYRFLHGGQPLCMQYHSGRLYCARVGGLSVLDLSKEAITAAKKGKCAKPVQACDLAANHDTIPPLERVESTRKRPRDGTVVECVQDGATLRVKPAGAGFDKRLSCEFPVNLKRKGSKFIVDGIKASESGKFYRVIGGIREVMK